MALVAGIDSSTQSTKIMVRDAETGELVRQGQAPHPPGTEVDPEAWWQAYLAASSGLLEGVGAIGVAAQQHGMVTLDAERRVVRPALLWNDVRSADAAAALTAELGGPQAWADAVGTVPVASITATKLRWLAQHEPENAARVAAVVLPHDYLTWRLAGGGRAPLYSDRGDASGTGYWSPFDNGYRFDLLERAFGRRIEVPEVLAPNAPAGQTPDGVLLAPGTGDNMGAALGLGAAEGDVVVSVGTSGVVSAVSDTPTADPTGIVAGFADATGRYLPLVCTLNAARVLEAGARMLGVGLDEFSDLALSAPAGAGGLSVVPYFEGERTPNLPEARGQVSGLNLDNATPANLARAFVEGMLCMLADGLQPLATHTGQAARRVVLIGGGARSRAVREIAPAVLGVPVDVPSPGEYVADGGARQAAWVLSGAAEPPAWPVAGMQRFEADPTPQVLEAYALAREQLASRWA